MAPVAKRRRLDDVTSRLSKPFKSPLRTPSKNPDESDMSRANASNSKNKNIQVEALNKGDDAVMLSSPDNDTTTTPRPSKITPYRTPLRINNTGQSLIHSPSPSTRSHPALLSLQKQHRSLQSQLSALHSELDIVQQAVRIESSGKDQELEALIVKWRSVSQRAAEELFGSARERVHRMGGVAAWRERMKQGQQRWCEERDDSTNHYQEEEDDEILERARTDDDYANANFNDYQSDKRPIALKEQDQEQEKEEDNESFTMDMMLASLNIDLDIIGFDKLNQRWIP